MNLSISANVNASIFTGNSVEFDGVDVKWPNYFSIEVSPVTSFSVSLRILGIPLSVRIGGSVNGNTGSFARGDIPAGTYDIIIDAMPAGSTVLVTITSMYLTDEKGNYTTVFNVNNVPPGVYSIKQDGKEVAKAYAGVQPPVTCTLDLGAGWNLVSIPLAPVNDSITSVIPPEAMANIRIIWHYDNSNPDAPVWKFYKPGRAVNTLINLTDGMGFWVLASRDFSFTVSGMVPEENRVTIKKGWNMVGPEGLSTRTPAEQYGTYYLTWGYTGGQWYYYKPSRTINTLTEIRPARGYWVLVR